MSLTDDRNFSLTGSDEAAAFAAAFRPVGSDFFGFRAIYMSSNRTKQQTRAINDIFHIILLQRRLAVEFQIIQIIKSNTCRPGVPGLQEPLPHDPAGQSTARSFGIPNDLESFWVPFTPNRAFKRAPRLIARAKGMHYYTPQDRPVLDGTAGLWCTKDGHNRDPIVAAIAQQAETLDYAPAFQFAHSKSFELASRVAALAPADLDRVFFCNSGSEAVDTALKIALAYHNVRGEAARTRLIGRERGYHGVGFGGISVGGMVNNRKHFGSLLSGVDHLPATYNREHQAFTKGEPEWGAHLADALEGIVALHDASTIAAVIVEPMAGSTGVLPAPKGYLKRLREICDKHGILLIFDEV